MCLLRAPSKFSPFGAMRRSEVVKKMAGAEFGSDCNFFQHLAA
jgi:hypothetical protein